MQSIKRRIKNVLIRDLTDEDREVIAMLMQETGCRQASKALIKAAHAYTRCLAIIKRQAAMLNELERENKAFRRNAQAIVGAAEEITNLLLSKESGEK